MGTRTTLLRPGLTPYQRAWELQQRISDDVRAGGDPALILLEHPPTYTLGVRGRAVHLLLTEGALRALGAAVIRTDRGGDVTFHGPGQIIAYPIIDLRRYGEGPAWYVRTLEAVLMDVLAEFGISGTRIAGRPGVWVGDAKIAAIGVRVAGRVTTHGFALNVNTDLSYFRHIIPCGLADAGVTSMQRITGTPMIVRAVEGQIVDAFARNFGLEFEPSEARPTGEPMLAGAAGW